MNENREQAQELATSEDAVRGLVVGNRVYDPLLFSTGIVEFTAKQYIFLKHFRLGIPLDEAAARASMTPEQANRFLDKPATRTWLQDRALKDYIKEEWAEPGKWWQQGDEWLKAPKEQKPNKNDVEIWKEFGRRVCPISENQSGGAKIEINIDPMAVQEAFRRQQVIEAQIVNDKAANA